MYENYEIYENIIIKTYMFYFNSNLTFTIQIIKIQIFFVRLR